MLPHPLKTAERAAALAEVARHFPFLHLKSAADLLALVRAELGHAEALDAFQNYAAHSARALPPDTILHVISGNTPAAGLQSLLRGLLLGTRRHFCKIPAQEVPELADFVRRLPESFRAEIEISTDLPPAWVEDSAAIVVFGSDETIAHFRALARPDQRFVGHGHRVSFAAVFSHFEPAVYRCAARDVSLFDQLGCLSPQVIYVAENPRLFAEKLAVEMADFSAAHPRGEVSLSAAAAVRQAREEKEFCRANGEDVEIWSSHGSTEWTVIFESAAGFPRSPLFRTIFVKPFPVDWSEELARVSAYLSCVGIWPATRENAEIAAGWPVSRICPLGKMQAPPMTWHQDGEPVLLPLVRWIDAELDPRVD